ncbi:hypothetical protein SRABI76_02693 [Microbacterium oxydans]|uniref:Uncharacterized protein n=1 Tax=Microbacterium oxydans TaxID=82380 RepID=A0A0F0L811_9MICO|nr:hypothetical protein [Microbacterium oxydans]KJL29327.1 hypothetical protein RS83_01956 [Microbacterium oxydans]CAH0228607.1 hypothetical protein SRABI76_02693 [Microbacterium oxydans]
MPQRSDDDDELRMLQRKAYGRDGGLTDAEAARLRDLERREAPAASIAHAAEVSLPDAAEVSRVPTHTPEVVPAVEEATEDPSVDDAPTTSRVRPRLRELRRHWRFATVASVLLLAIGVGAGWALFGQDREAISLTAEQQQRRLELYDFGDYDEGSLRAVGQDDEGALVWYGTKKDSELQCLVLDVGEESGQQCAPRDDSNSFSLMASVTIPGVADPASEFVNDIGVNAYLLLSTTREPMVSIQRWEQTNGSLVEQYPGAERARVEELMSEGIVRSLSIIGSFRDEPVWLLDDRADNGMQTCLVVDAASGDRQCVPTEVAIKDGISTVVFVDDGADGSEAWTIQVAYTVSQTPYLVITRDPTPASVTFSEFSENDDDSAPGRAPTG